MANRKHIAALRRIEKELYAIARNLEEKKAPNPSFQAVMSAVTYTGDAIALMENGL